MIVLRTAFRHAALRDYMCGGESQDPGDDRHSMQAWHDSGIHRTGAIFCPKPAFGTDFESSRFHLSCLRLGLGKAPLLDVKAGTIVTHEGFAPLVLKCLMTLWRELCQNSNRKQKKQLRSQDPRNINLDLQMRFDASTFAGKCELQSSLPSEHELVDEMPEHEKQEDKEEKKAGLVVIIDLNGVLVHGSSVGNGKVWSSCYRPEAHDLVTVLFELKKTHGINFGFYSGMNREDMKSIVVPILASCGLTSLHGEGDAEDELHLRFGPEPEDTFFLLDEFEFLADIEWQRDDGQIRISHQRRAKDPISPCWEGRLIVVSGSARKSKNYRDYVLPVCNFSHELSRSGQATSFGHFIAFLKCNSVLKESTDLRPQLLAERRRHQAYVNLMLALCPTTLLYRRWEMDVIHDFSGVLISSTAESALLQKLRRPCKCGPKEALNVIDRTCSFLLP